MQGPSGLAVDSPITYYAGWGTASLTKQSQRLGLVAASIVAVALMGASSGVSSFVPQLPMPPNGAMIFNAGNGDFAGYRIVVSPDGQAVAVDGAGRSASELQPDVAQGFFQDLAAAGPLDKLAAGDCASKNAGAATTVEVNSAVVISYGGQHTPALSCVSDPRAERLLMDATTIQHALYVQVYRKRVTPNYTLAYGKSGPTYKGEGGGGYTSVTSADYGGFNSGGFDNSGFSEDQFQFDSFKNESFSDQAFSAGNFTFDNFHNEYPLSNGPFIDQYPSTTQVFTNLPYAQPYSSSPTSGNLPSVFPYQGAPGTALTTTSPWGNAPANASPFVSPNLHSLP